MTDKLTPTHRSDAGTAAPAAAHSGRRIGAVDRLAVLLASFGLCGFFPLAPATFASAVAAAVIAFAPFPGWLGFALVAAMLLFAGAWASGRTERLYGHDPSAAVIDEVLGMWITMGAAPALLQSGDAAVQLAALAAGFVFFRFFDIVKVFPGRWLERAPGGWGVMLDDAAAGVYAHVALRLLLWAWPEPRLGIAHAVGAGALVLLLLVFRRPLAARYAKKRSRVGVAFGSEGRKP